MNAGLGPTSMCQSKREMKGVGPRAVSFKIHLRLPIGRVIAGMAIVYTKGNETLKRLTIFGWAGLLLLALTSLVWPLTSSVTVMFWLVIRFARWIW